MDDIAPELLELIQNEFKKNFDADKEIQRIYKLIQSASIEYDEANKFAIRCGELLSDALNKFVTVDALPEGKMWYNIAQKIMQPTLENNYNLINDVCNYAQQTINGISKVTMNYVVPPINQNKIDGFIDKLSSDDFENVQWMLGEPVVNYSQSVVDDAIRTNMDFHVKSGLTPRIRRTLDSAETRTVTRGKQRIKYSVPCDWCKALAGTYDYGDMDTFIYDNIFRRHENCRCTVEYINDKKAQDVWTKTEREVGIAERKRILSEGFTQTTPQERLARIQSLNNQQS